LVAIGLALVGCSLLAPRPDYTKFFVLTLITDSSNPAPAKSNLAIGVGSIVPAHVWQPTATVRRLPLNRYPSAGDEWRGVVPGFGSYATLAAGDLMTGHLDMATEDIARRGNSVAVLIKPFARSLLMEAIRKALALR
jgi:hypothetical protein